MRLRGGVNLLGGHTLTKSYCDGCTRSFAWI